MDILVNQVKCPDGYKKCQCLNCKAKGKVGVEGNDNVNQGNCFADVNVNDNVKLEPASQMIMVMIMLMIILMIMLMIIVIQEYPVARS